MRDGRSNGARAWAGLTLYVAMYDVYAVVRGDETLSSAFARSVSHPKHRWKTTVLWVYLTGHLFDVWPSKLDPLDRLGCLGRKAAQGQNTVQ